MQNERHWEVSEGSPFPLGVSWIEQDHSYNFALYTKHATGLVLEFFDDVHLENPLYTFVFDWRANKSGPIWHCRIPKSELGTARYYAYRVDGPPAGKGFEWHAFDADKLLLDPYSRATYFPSGFSRDAARLPGPNRGRAVLGVLEPCACISTPLSVPFHPKHASDLVIYELHVRGFTYDESSGVGQERRGTFLGVIDKIPYLVDLGITAVELMPIFQFDPAEGNYWGYMPLSFFAPHSNYSTQKFGACQIHEFREMVQALHMAGIEVILDVVYNHTCEGDDRGPNYSFKGIDNTSYYMLHQGNGPKSERSIYANFSGTGNTLHTANRAVRQIIVDSLRYWTKEMGVDGFRFDLASVFSRNSDGTINLGDPPIFGQISSDPELAQARLIAEPWDAGGIYQLGRKFPGQLWMQWNGQFRDTVQRFVRGDSGTVLEMMTRLYGSSDLFPDDCFHSNRPWQSVNYVTSHDGYTMVDLVSFTTKNNWVNGHQNLDGHSDLSSNCGYEGNVNVPDDVLLLRKKQMKNFVCLLMLANGTPMLRMGDEFMNTQNGNNNPYNQDNHISWIDWSNFQTNADMYRFFREMIHFRRSHALLGHSHFWRESVRWFGTKSSKVIRPDINAFSFFLDGKEVGDRDLYVMLNFSNDIQLFSFQVASSRPWRRVIDTAQASPHDFVLQGVLEQSPDGIRLEPFSIRLYER